MIFRAKYSIYKLLVNFGLGESIDIASILTVSFNFREIQLGLMFLFFFFFNGRIFDNFYPSIDSTFT